MANQRQVALLRQGAETWNQWREENRTAHIDLSGADLDEANLSGANLRGAYLDQAELSRADLSGADLREADLTWTTLIGTDLSGADLREANLGEADLSRAKLNMAKLSGAELSGANLSGAYLRGAFLGQADLRWADLNAANLSGTNFTRADLTGADLSRANLSHARLAGADLSRANLTGATLTKADLSRASLTEADLTQSVLVNTNLEAATLKDCRIYGISAWDLRGTPAEQSNLIITPPGQPAITVDNLKVAQFIYLLLNNPEVRETIDTITTKVVLILGRFTDERKAVLDALREELRRRKYIPILFDFDKPASKSFIETVITLAGMARFVIADVTDAKVVLQELQSIVTNLPSVPVQPILLQDAQATIVLTDFLLSPWFLMPHLYRDRQDLLASLAEKVITPAEEKANEIKQRREAAEAAIKALGSRE